jgi:hypothetical protein
MPLLKFGILWTLITSVMLIILLKAGQINIWVLIFWGIGIFMIIKGVIELVRNGFTTKKGVLCYGIIKSVSTTGLSVNGNPEYKADVAVYIESENKVVHCTEKIGFNPEEYEEGSCVKVKYYKDDINFIEKNVDFNMITYNAQNNLSEYYIDKKSEVTLINPKVIYKNDNIIEVNGVNYKKID